MFALNDLDDNTGDTSYVLNTGAQGFGTDSQTYGASFKFKMLSGQSYEFGCGSISEKINANASYDCNITVSIPGYDGSDNNDNDSGNPDEEPETPVEVIEAEVKIQPATMNGTCPLSSLEHLNLAIKTEQALKLRLDRQATKIEEALDAVSDSGANPGPALRKLDALIEFIRDDIGASRNITQGGLEFSKRHLVCAKQKLTEENLSPANKTAAESEINQAIVNDDEAITAIQTEDSNINSEAVRLSGTLESTSSKIHFGLFDKGQAGEIIDPSFTMPDFETEDVNDIFEEFQVNIAALAEELIEKLENQETVIADNDLNPSIDAILAVQNGDCISQFFDEVNHEYTKVHTAVKEALEKVKEAAEEAAQAEEPDPEAPSVKEGNAAAQESKKLDLSFQKTIVAVTKTKDKFTDTYGGLVGNDAHRTQRKIKALLELLRRAELANDNQWRRLIKKELKKFAGFFGNGA